MPNVRFEAFWRVAVVQLVAVAVLSLLLALVFSHGFFESWGWLVGPASWLGCAWVTARIVGVDPASTLVRALLAGLVSLLAVIVGLHWLGLLVAVGLFAYLCAREPGEPVAWT
jgi:ABC-type multidrug transport system permease subunit